MYTKLLHNLRTKCSPIIFASIERDNRLANSQIASSSSLPGTIGISTREERAMSCLLEGTGSLSVFVLLRLMEGWWYRYRERWPHSETCHSRFDFAKTVKVCSHSEKECLEIYRQLIIPINYFGKHLFRV